jgi:hypothetical protein
MSTSLPGAEPIRLHEYEGSVFDSLNDFPIARDELESHRERISDLGDIICRHDLQALVGVNLLHKHFDLLSGEIVLRQFDHEGAIMRPIAYSECPNAVPYLWQVANGNDGYGFYPLEFVRIDDCDWREQSRQAIDRIVGSVGFLDEMAAKIKELAFSDIFGLAALFARRPFVLDAETTLLETSDEANRILTLRPAKVSQVKSMDTTKTLWVFTAPSVSSRVGTDCASHCLSHCNNHCVGHVPEQVAKKRRMMIA